MSVPDRKRLWGKSANRCAICQTPLTKPETASDPEAVIGEEAHICGGKPGATRYSDGTVAWRDSYENRILLCRNDHSEIDQQPGEWTEQRLLAVKARHEALMAQRTGHGERAGLTFESPAEDTKMPMIINGRELLDIVGGAWAYQSTHDALEGPAEREVASRLLQGARDWGEIYDDVGPSAHIDAEAELDGAIAEALAAELVLFGRQVETTVRLGEARNQWPVAYLHLHRAVNLRARAVA